MRTTGFKVPSGYAPICCTQGVNGNIRDKFSHAINTFWQRLRVIKSISASKSFLGVKADGKCPQVRNVKGIFALVYLFFLPVTLYSISTVVFNTNMCSILTSPFQSLIIGWPESNSFGNRRYQTLRGSFWWGPVWTKTCEFSYSCIFKNVEQALTEIPGK